jgi:glucose-6-phosphate isomerase
VTEVDGPLGEIEAAAGLAVRGASNVPGATEARRRLIEAGVPGLLSEKDPTLWGDEAEAEAKIRLGWVDTFRRSRDLLPTLAALREACADLRHVVLAGMGGSSLAPEVIARTLGVELTVLDTTDPHQVRAALADRLDSTVVVVASKSGSTVETDSHRRAYLGAFTDAGLADVGRRFVVVTDPGSPLEATGHQMGAHVVLADPDVGGRYSALTAFGLVPAALAGVNVAELLDQAEEFARSLAQAEENPSLALGAALGAAALAGRDKVAVVDDGTGITGLGDWVEQLIAESTGKDGTGILPVVPESPTAPVAAAADVLTVTAGGSLPPAEVPGGGVRPDVAVNGPLGAQFLAWEAATAFAGRLLGINPFDQPNVTESKENTNRILAAGLPEEAPRFSDGPVDVHADDTTWAAIGATTQTQVLAGLLGQVGRSGYLAVMAYLDRLGDATVAEVRPLLARAGGRPVTFGWGPRFLHSTGQYHKGGPPVGVYLQITGAVVVDLEVPGRPFTFGTLQAAQAAGDRQALIGRGRPLLRLHLTDRAAGERRLLAAARETVRREDRDQ